MPRVGPPCVNQNLKEGFKEEHQDMNKAASMKEHNIKDFSFWNAPIHPLDSVTQKNITKLRNVAVVHVSRWY